MATDFLEGFDMNHRVWKILDTGFMGTTKYHLCKLLEQHYNPSWHDMTAVFEAFRFDTNTNERTHCVVMICEQLNPGLLDDDQTIEKATQETSPSSSTASTCSIRYWQNRLIFDSCFNPYSNGSFIENFTQAQGQYDDSRFVGNWPPNQGQYYNSGSFPGGYLHVFAAAMPSELKPIGYMPGILKDEDMLAIKFQLYELPASKRNFVASSSFLPTSSFSSSSNLDDRDFIYHTAAIWYNRDTKRIWVPENTVKNWYARQSETAQLQEYPPKDAQKQFEEFWEKLVKSWKTCCTGWDHPFDFQKVLSSPFQLCFRDRGGNTDNNTQSPSAFLDPIASSPSSSSEKEWTMIESGSASS